MATVQYDSKENKGHKFWTARYGRYSIRIDANRRGVYPWLITLEGHSVRNGVAPDRDITGVIKWGDVNFAFAQVRRLRDHIPWSPP